MIRIAIALLLLLAVPANAQDRSAPGASSIFHDAHGRVTGSGRTDANGGVAGGWAAQATGHGCGFVGKPNRS